ncbi:MAG: methyltransferase domain-containing protein [Myxococcales bacterium]|nr:methyltransferase domain-containing protein [Myxococcales bacterium]
MTSSAAGVDLIGSIIRYYDHTHFDYSSLWAHRSDPAFHYGYYDEQCRHHRRAVANANATLANFAAVKQGDIVLDAGCGRGGSCFWLAEKLGARPVGVNLVTSQLVYARKEADRRGLSGRTEFRRADYTKTPFEASSFDVVWALESLCHSPRKVDFYSEACRLLRPGGRLVIAEYMVTEIDMLPADQKLVADWLSGWSIPSLDTETQHKENADSMGFERIEVHDWTNRMRRSSLRLYCLARICHWLSFILNKAGLRSDVAHGNLLSARYQYEALQKRLWQYKILVAQKPGGTGRVL